MKTSDIAPKLSQHNETLLMLSDMADDLRRCLDIIKKAKKRDHALLDQFYLTAKTFRMLTHLIVRK